MKNQQIKKYMLAFACICTLTLSGCQNKSTPENTSKPIEQEDTSPAQVNENADETEDSASTKTITTGEGTNVIAGQELDIANTDAFKLGDTITFQKGGKDWYTLTVTSIEETDMRNTYSDTQADHVVLVKYTYKNIASADPVFLDDMRFKFADSEDRACELYPLDTEAQALPVNIGESCDVEIAYVLDSDKKDITLLFTDNVCGENKTVTIQTTLK